MKYDNEVIKKFQKIADAALKLNNAVKDEHVSTTCFKMLKIWLFGNCKEWDEGVVISLINMAEDLLKTLKSVESALVTAKESSDGSHSEELKNDLIWRIKSLLSRYDGLSLEVQVDSSSDLNIIIV